MYLKIIRAFYKDPKQLIFTFQATEIGARNSKSW